MTRIMVPAEDMLHDGYVGLLHAAQRYDYTRRLSFWDFAGPWIGTAVQTGLRTQRSNMPLDQEDERKWLKLRKAYSDLLNEGPGEIGPGPLAMRTGLPKEAVVALMSHSLRRRISLNQPLNRPHNMIDDWLVGHRIAHEPLTPTPASNPNSMIHHLLLAVITRAQLKPSQLAVISLRTGVRLEQLVGTTIWKRAVSYDAAFEQVGGIANPTNSEIANACGLSPSSVESYASLGLRALTKAAQLNE